MAKKKETFETEYEAMKWAVEQLATDPNLLRFHMCHRIAKGKYAGRYEVEFTKADDKK